MPVAFLWEENKDYEEGTDMVKQRKYLRQDLMNFGTEGTVGGAFKLASLLHEQGWRKHRTLATVGELEALAGKAVVKSKGGIVFRKYKGWFREGVDGWERAGSSYEPYKTYDFERDPDAFFPFEVLDEGDES